MIITLHWWFGPLVLMIFGFFGVIMVSARDTGGYVNGLFTAFAVAIWLIFSLAAWFVGALFK